ncbi:MAG: UTP--glucose-1-phosphate uridylyltransferase, partial [Solirubrobacteraceae bacterium]
MPPPIRLVSLPIRDAIVPVAGLGTRLLPATRSAPKEMLPIVDKPVVQYVVEELSRAGIDRVLMVTGRRKRAIEDHFDADPELGSPPPAAGVQLFYTRQPTPAGLGDAVARGARFADPSSPGVVVALGDAILEPRTDGGPGIVARLIDAHAAHGADATIAVTEVPPAQTGRYGIVVGSPLESSLDAGLLAVTRIIEKPARGTVDSTLAVAARYVLGPAVFAALRDQAPGTGGEIQLTDAIASVIERGGRVLAVPLIDGERRHDIGTIEGYCRAFLRHALTHPELGEALRAQARTLLH